MILIWPQFDGEVVSFWNIFIVLCLLSSLSKSQRTWDFQSLMMYPVGFSKIDFKWNLFKNTGNVWNITHCEHKINSFYILLIWFCFCGEVLSENEIFTEFKISCIYCRVVMWTLYSCTGLYRIDHNYILYYFWSYLYFVSTNFLK